MTVSTEVDHNEYTGNGVTTTFPYTFRIFDKANLVVQTLDSNDNIATLVLDTDYTVTGSGSYSGGNIILNAPLVSGWRITIDRELEVVQETDLRNQGRFFAEVHENAFDYLTMLIQQSFAWTRRALLKPSFLAKFYDALGNSIINLGDPKQPGDAVNRRFVESLFVDETASVTALKNLLQVTTNTTDLEIFKFPNIPYGIFLTDNNSPNFNLTGPGSLTSEGVDINGDLLSYNPAKENVFYTPGTYLRRKTGESYPTRQNPAYPGQCYRFVLSQGSKLKDETKTLQWVTAVGNTIGCDPEEWQLIDAFGTNAMIYAGRVSRSTALGSEVMAWFGARSQADLITNCHDFWRKPAGNPYLPGEPGWNGADLETQFPGIGARLAAFSGYVTDPELAGYCTGVGRDALNHIVAGVRNTAGGYGSAQHLFSGSYNSAFGALALQSMVFGDGNSGFGDQAGRYANDCSNSTFLGYAAGRSVRGAQSSVFIGDRAADGVQAATRAVIIGPEAGRNHPTNLDNKLLIANQPYGGNLPIISGDFTPNNVGINILPENIRARMHVRYASSGSTLTPQFGLLVEGATTAGVTIETSSSGFGQLRFADQDSVSSGFLEYSHASDSLSFGVGGASRWRMESTGTLMPMTDNAQSVGRAAFRPSVIYAGTGTINTSDEREKNRMAILDAEKAAAIEIKSDIWKFQFSDAVEKKNDDGARYHFGVGAQSVGAILQKHGLDPEMYAFYCYDEWENEYKIIPQQTVEHPTIFSSLMDENGNQLISKEAWVEVIKPEEKILVKTAGGRYGIRYEELLCFIMAAL